MSDTPKLARAGELILIGGGSGAAAEQIAAIAAGLRAQGAGIGDLCLLRVFFRPADISEDEVKAEIAAALAGRVKPALTLVPVPMPEPSGGAVSIEAVAVATGYPRALAAADDPAFSAGLRKGQFLFTSAVRASQITGLVDESHEVMEGLRHVLDGLGAGFGDVVRMNRWYHAAGTKDEWEPSARAVAQRFVEPGPIATAISLPEPLAEGRAIQIELMAMLAEDGTTLPKRHSWPKGHWDWPIHLPYRHGLECGGLAFVGGQVSLDEKAEVIDPEHLDRQVARSRANIDRVLAGFDGTARLLHLGIYCEIPDGGLSSTGPGARALRDLAQGEAAAVLVGFPYLSYPKMRVEIEAIAAIT